VHNVMHLKTPHMLCWRLIEWRRNCKKTVSFDGTLRDLTSQKPNTFDTILT
jgi:hypothetical protein